MEWFSFNDRKPESGAKIVIACDDGCSSSLAMSTDSGILDAEDGEEIGSYYFNRSIWAYLPDDYAIAFTERTEADWY